jgi:hypothetical protein
MITPKNVLCNKNADWLITVTSVRNGDDLTFDLVHVL